MIESLAEEGDRVENRWIDIQKALLYIERHLTEELEIIQIAKQACVSAFYFQRVFTKRDRETD